MLSADKWQVLYDEVRAYKKTLPDDAQIKHRGFSIFFAPPRRERLLLVGLNPSRSDSGYTSKYPEAEKTHPEEHLYCGERGGKLSQELSSMLVAGSGEIVEPAEIHAWQEIMGGTKINVFFFGSKNWTEWSNEEFWGSGGLELRREVELKCKKWTREIIRSILPNRILCEGFAVFDQLCEMFRPIPGDEEVVRRPGRGNQRLFVHKSLLVNGATVPILGILHPTGGRGRSRAETVALGREIITFCDSV